jgi:hypothetical protein
MLFEFFFWWYGRGWKRAWRDCFLWVQNVQQAFSVDVLIKTLFSPWKRIVTLPGRSIDEKIHAAIDNLLSRVVGFIVRMIVLIVAVIMIIITFVAGLAVAIAWPFLPFLGLALISWGLLG